MTACTPVHIQYMGHRITLQGVDDEGIGGRSRFPVGH
jgi:hypothetical protein